MPSHQSDAPASTVRRVSPMVAAKLALAVAGVVVWGLGVRMSSEMLRWTGIGLLALAFLLRFARGRQGS